MPSTASGSATATGAAVTCVHEADPENTCAAIANGPGWCECGNGPAKYAVMPSPAPQPCAWTTTPSTTNFDCPTPTPVAPYVTTGGDGATAGKCHVHVNEFQNCAGDAHDLSTEVFIWDVGGNQIGYQSIKEAGAADPLSVTSKLEAPLVVTPEHRGNYVQFNLGTEQFDTRQADQTALSWCSTGGWDPSEGPDCGIVQQISVSYSFLVVWLIVRLMG